MCSYPTIMYQTNVDLRAWDTEQTIEQRAQCSSQLTVKQTTSTRTTQTPSLLTCIFTTSTSSPPQPIPFQPGPLHRLTASPLPSSLIPQTKQATPKPALLPSSPLVFAPELSPAKPSHRCPPAPSPLHHPPRRRGNTKAFNDVGVRLVPFKPCAGGIDQVGLGARWNAVREVAAGRFFLFVSRLGGELVLGRCWAGRGEWGGAEWMGRKRVEG